MRPRQQAAALLLASALVGPARAQGSLAEAAERTRRAWLGHDAQAIVGQSGSVVFQTPGAAPSSPVDGAQAAALLRRYLSSAVERAVTVSAVREVESGRGTAEARWEMPNGASTRGISLT